ncbi:unnamed protein product [Phaedon cochleariae]|uniref:G-protein coupled receptors family 1 profile domain-containing protein n=1 Tax=Phaedon cochleariae TaxID=80249 RepID=A0A9N9SCS7_PHACE|nr:unnamed protein product [Phaedon cochleariae]
MHSSSQNNSNNNNNGEDAEGQEENHERASRGSHPQEFAAQWEPDPPRSQSTGHSGIPEFSPPERSIPIGSQFRGQKLSPVSKMDENTTDNSSDFDCDNFLEPDHLLANTYFHILIYFMYTAIFFIAFLGNSFVCYVVLSSPRMRTVTNYFITNLAVGDMLITVLCVPFTPMPLLKQYWPFGSVLCLVVNYSQALSVFVSAYTLVAISIDKYIVIMWPLKPRISKRFATSVIFLVWLVAGTTVIPTGMFAKTFQPVNDTYYAYCDRSKFRSMPKQYWPLDSVLCPVVNYSQALSVFFLMVMQYVIPSIVLLFTYTSIAAVIWCHRIPGEAENSRDIRIAKSKRKVRNL